MEQKILLFITEGVTEKVYKLKTSVSNIEQDNLS
jgi:hypothetical protein